MLYILQFYIYILYATLNVPNYLYEYSLLLNIYLYQKINIEHIFFNENRHH